MNRLFPFTIILLAMSLILSQCQSSEDTNREGQDRVQQKRQPAAISLEGRKLYPPEESEASRKRKDSLLQIARQNFEAHPDSLDNIIWMGRRLAYLSRYDEAIEIYTRGIRQFRESAELFRHRGHRYISLRKFDMAIADFEKAAGFAEGRPIEIEADGIPNKLNIPLSSLQFNIWYHWALAYYLKGDFEKAAELYRRCMEYSTNPDLLCATTDWLYMTYRRLGQKEQAEKLLEAITKDMEIIENESYFKRLMMYKGLKKPEELLALQNNDPESQLAIATQGYGVGNWYFYNGEKGKGIATFRKVQGTSYWPAFGYIAAEVEVVRALRQ